MKLRMYSLVLRQLTPMQKGIQTAHAVADYVFDNRDVDECDAWVCCDKTLIVLDAGTSQDLLDAIQWLNDNNVKHTVFKEPDLYDMPTAVCFLADERVWDTEMYPDYEHYIAAWQKSCEEMDTVRNKDGNDTGGRHLIIHHKPNYREWIGNTFDDVDPKLFLNLREFIFSKKLSM